MRVVAFLLVCLLVGACRHGGIHKKGDRMASVRGFGSPWPIKGKALAWFGERDVEYIGVGMFNHWYTSDRIAIGLGISYLNYQYDGRNIDAVEIEANYRQYLFEHDNGKYAYFWDFNMGLQMAEAPVPDGATRHEMTFAFGPGMEIPLTDKGSVFAGIMFHHQSNANGRRADDNPSQNDFRLWVSYGWDW
jgi:hypothetical protein